MLLIRRSKFDSWQWSIFSFWDRVVVIVAGLRDERSGFESQQGKIFFCSLCPDRFWAPASLLFSGYLGFFQGVKWMGCEVDCLPKSDIEVKIEWSYTSPPICLRGVDGVNFVSLSPVLPRIPTQPHIQWIPEASKQSVKLTSTTFSAQVYNVQTYLAAKCRTFN
jgi:hypothetical protein